MWSALCALGRHCALRHWARVRAAAGGLYILYEYTIYLNLYLNQLSRHI